MKITELGGEFALIDRVVREGGCLVGAGDDCAVIESGKDKHLLFTTDMLCEGDHFRPDWASPNQIGAKAMEVNVSDVAAMGGLPRHAVVALSLTKHVTVEFMDGLYEGMYSVADKYGFTIVGGDTTRSSLLTISVALLGEVEPQLLSLRSDAKVGDKICVTGDLGKSRAGLELLLAGKEGAVGPHLSPKCRLNEARAIASYCNAMIDVSDGLASEVNHICEMSGVGGVINMDAVPIAEGTVAAAKVLGHDPYDYAMGGGEDFELVFTIPKDKLGGLSLDCPVTVVGEVLEPEAGVNLEAGGMRAPLKGGYDHFK